MSGITGWVKFNDDPLDLKRSILTKMVDTLSRRGPDGQWLWVDDHVALGQACHQLREDEDDKQPMHLHFNGQKWSIIFNGVLYNSVELREELEREGVTFSSLTDTEVLVKAYGRWGTNCLSKLNGIFAFAIWNDREHTLFMARDRLGVKPFFYTEKDGALIFGSELKAILAHPKIKAEVDREGLAEVLGLGPSRTPGCGIFKGIRELRPGHALFWRPEGYHVFRYWQVASQPHQDSLAETIEKVRHLVTDAVRRQLNADVCIASFLSGGLDSSAVSAIAANHLSGRPLHTFSIDYVENERFFTRNDFQPDPDGPYITRMIDHIDSDHEHILISPEILFHYLDEAMIVRDQPGMADIDSSLLWACKQIPRKAKVVLTGEGADEIFGGYPWFYREELLHKNAFPWMVSIDQRENVLKRDWKEKLRLSEYIQQRYQETLDEVPVMLGEPEEEKRRREMFYLNMVWFMTSLLDRKDRMSMGAGIEARVPFADHRLVEYLWNVPWSFKRLNGQEKGLLRKAMEGILPQEVLYRKKSPYPKTFHPKYTQLVRERLLSIINDKQSPLVEIVDRKALHRLTESEAFVERPWFGQLMRGPQVMAYYIQLDTWFKTYNVNIVP